MSALTSAHRAAGGLGVAAGVLAVLGAQAPLLAVRAASAVDQLLGVSDVSVPEVPAVRWAALAGAVLAVMSAGLVLPEHAGRVRPAVSVLWAALLPAAFSALHTAAVAIDASASGELLLKLTAPVLGLGAGGWLLIGACGLACLTGLGCLAAGVFDREAQENREEQEGRDAQEAAAAKRKRRRPASPAPAASLEAPFPRAGTALLALAGGCGVVGLLLPLYLGRGFRSAWLPDVPFSSDAFGQLVLAAAVCGAALLGPRSRPGQRGALFAGAALALALYAGGYPLVTGGVAGAGPGPGFWLSLAGAVFFAVAAGQAGWRLGGGERARRQQRGPARRR